MGCCLSKFEDLGKYLNNEELNCELSQSKEFFDISLQLETEEKETNDWHRYREGSPSDTAGFLSTFILSDRKIDTNRSGSIVDSFAVSPYGRDNK